MKANGRETLGVVGAWNATQTETDMKESSSTESHTAKAFTHGPMARSMKESGLVVSKKAREFGKESLVTATLGSGASQKPLVMASINGKMAIDTKENGKTALSMVKARTFLQMAIAFQALTIWASRRARANTNGRMEAFTSASLKTDLSMGKANGRSVTTIRTATCTRVATNKTKRMAWGSSLGSQAITTRVATGTMRGTGMEKCFGKMAPVTRVNGTRVFKMASAEWSFPMDE